MTKPNIYELGGVEEVYFTPTDQNGQVFQPTFIRVSFKEPTGNIFTVSGAELTLTSGVYSYLYEPATTGWYEYEIAVEHGDRKIVKSNGFDVIDNVF